MPLTVAVVELHYVCGACTAPVEATLRLQGELEGPSGPHCVCKDLKCPSCGLVSKVVFNTAGDVRTVDLRGGLDYLAPIWN